MVQTKFKKLLKDIPIEILEECSKKQLKIIEEKDYYKKSFEEYIEFANWNVKNKMLINAKEILVKNGINPNILLDLASGRGNDLNRWIQLGIPRVIGIELDSEQIKKAIDRYKKNSKRIKVSYVQGSASDYNLVKKQLYGKTVPLITCNFAMNYFFENQTSLESFFSTVSDSMRDGSLFIGTAADGDTIKMLMDLMCVKDSGSGSGYKDCSVITNMYSIKYLSNKIENTGSKYKFRIETPFFEDHDATEYIIRKSFLQDFAKKYSLVPYALENRVPAIFNFLEKPLELKKFRKGNDKNKYYERPVSIASLYFGFSFIKASKELLYNIENPKGLIIIPYRDRKEQLDKLLKVLKSDIRNESRNYDILVSEQSQGKPFNRGLSLNTAVKSVFSSEYNYYIFHDVDLIPDKTLLEYYSVYPVNPIHLGARGQRYSQPELTIFENKYADKESGFIGGVFSISKNDFNKVNGFPNNFWGWGAEDDAFRDRLIENKIPYVDPPEGSVYDLEEMDFKTKKETLLKTPDSMIPKEERRKLRTDATKNWKQNGINQLSLLNQYEIGFYGNEKDVLKIEFS